MAPDLEAVKGNFEIFNPGFGANMAWHRDGFLPGTYLAHCYLDPSDETMNWLEVALPERPERGQRSAEFDECALAFLHDDSAQKDCIDRHNFIPFPMRGALGALLVFEDAEVFHRTPLTALAGGHARRPVARVDFYGRSADGTELAFRRPEADACGWSPLQPVELPGALHGVCAEYAERCRKGGAQVDLPGALDAYIAGEAQLVSQISSLVASRC